MTALDRRLIDAGITVSTATLAAIFADHYRGIPAKFTCPGCGHLFADNDSTGDCPTNTLVRPLLQGRQRENPKALNRLSADQREDLKRSPRTARRRAPVHRPPQGELFDVTPYQRTKGLR